MDSASVSTAGERFQRLVDIMSRLRGPGGCPWDREQTFDTIKPYLLEETYEVLDSIDARDWPAGIYWLQIRYANGKETRKLTRVL